jgi:hypothetical protein
MTAGAARARHGISAADQRSSPPSASINDAGHRWSGSSILLLLFGVILTGIGLYFLALRPPLLSEDLRYLGTSQGQIQAAAPHLTAWLTHVFRVLGGYISATGVLTMALAATAYRAHRPGAGITAAAAGAASIGLMTAVNFSIQSDLDGCCSASRWCGYAALFCFAWKPRAHGMHRRHLAPLPQSTRAMNVITRKA